jgi:hypothetical protein
MTVSVSSCPSSPCPFSSRVNLEVCLFDRLPLLAFVRTSALLAGSRWMVFYTSMLGVCILYLCCTFSIWAVIFGSVHLLLLRVSLLCFCCFLLQLVFWYIPLFDRIWVAWSLHVSPVRLRTYKAPVPWASFDAPSPSWCHRYAACTRPLLLLLC